MKGLDALGGHAIQCELSYLWSWYGSSTTDGGDGTTNSIQLHCAMNLFFRASNWRLSTVPTTRKRSWFGPSNQQVPKNPYWYCHSTLAHPLDELVRKGSLDFFGTCSLDGPNTCGRLCCLFTSSKTRRRDLLKNAIELWFLAPPPPAVVLDQQQDLLVRCIIYSPPKADSIMEKNEATVVAGLLSPEPTMFKNRLACIS
jgi:hypothetical protein